MDGLISIVGSDLNAWEEESHDSNRYSIFTQNLMLAEKVSKRQHLSPRTSRFKEDDDRAFRSAESRSPSVVRADSPTIPQEDVHRTTETLTTQPPPPKSGAAQANIGRPRTSGRSTPQTSQSSSGDWTWRPSIPQRVSSMDTRRKKGLVPGRPDLATFHRRSCQLFTSLDTTLSNATNRSARDTGSPNGSLASTSPSLTSSISTQATSILDDSWHHTTPAFPSFHLELEDPAWASLYKRPHSPGFGDFLSEVNHTPHLAVRKSSSQLSPHITSTKPIIWTSDTTRQAEYAKIDAAHTGLKGFVKRMFPRSWGWVHGKRRNFHLSPVIPTEVESPKADDDSVRRFRISIASATQEAIRGVEEHGVSGMNTPMRCPSPLITDDIDDATNPGLDTHGRGLTNMRKSKPKNVKPVNKVLAKVQSSDAPGHMFRPQTNKLHKAKRGAKMLSRELGH